MISSKAFVKISCRLVPNQEPDHIKALLREAIQARAPKGVKIEFVDQHKGDPYVGLRGGPIRRRISRRSLRARSAYGFGGFGGVGAPAPVAMGKALVSTSIGAEGLAVENGRDLLLADDAPSFADAVILLLRDATMRRKIEQAAVRLAVQYDWSQVVKQFAQVLSNLVLRQPASGNSTGVRASGADPVRL